MHSSCTHPAPGGHIDAIALLSIEWPCDFAALQCSCEATNNGQKAAGRHLLVLKKENQTWRIIYHMTVV